MGEGTLVSTLSYCVETSLEESLVYSCNDKSIYQERDSTSSCKVSFGLHPCL